MLPEREFPVKDKSQISPEFFGVKNKTAKRGKVERREVKLTMQP